MASNRRKATNGTKATTGRLPKLAVRRLTAALSWIGEGGIVDHTDERPAIADARNLDAYADLADSQTRVTHRAAYERIARGMVAALFAPPTPADAIGALKIDWNNREVG